MALKLRPVSIKEACKIVGLLHRHNKAPQGGLFAVGVEAEDRLVGVAIIGRPIARALDDGWTCEVLRVATTGAHNACSILYGAASRAAKALGYRRIYTYTLAEEPGTSLKASGWVRNAEIPAQPTWSRPSRPRYQKDLFGNDERPPGQKIRWIKHLDGTGKVQR